MLGDNGIDISAMSLADTTDFGILRIIVSDIDKAREVLREIGVISKVTNVIAVYIDHKIGGLAAVLDHISDAGIGIEYMYAFANGSDASAIFL